ncbi:MAG: BMP family protein [Kiloniellaceae bacterium]
MTSRNERNGYASRGKGFGRRTALRLCGIAMAAVAVFALTGEAAQAQEKLKVAGVYTVPIQQKWVGTLHRALTAAKERGEIDYSFSEKVANTDYVRVMREYAEGGAGLIVGEAFGISREARRVADDYPNVAFLMGDPGGPHGENFSVFDNWIHEPCYLMGVVAGTLTKTNRIGMVGGHAIGEVNRLFHAFMEGARSVNPDVQFKVAFIGSWYDPPKAKEFAFAQIEAGVDVIYAERAGVVDAAREKGIVAFGNVNDMNKQENGTDVVVASALWHMEPAIDYAIAQVKAGTFKAEDYKEWTMMQAGGASLSPYYEFEDRIPAETRAQVEALTQQILSGQLVVSINDDEPKSTY